MNALSFWPARVAVSHRYTASAFLIGVVAFLLLPSSHGDPARVVFAWDIGSISLLAMFTVMLLTEGDDAQMARNAEAQQEGEWTVFVITLLSVGMSFVALTQLMSTAKDMHVGTERDLYIFLIAATLFLSWLVTHVEFALRYAHEYYQRSTASAAHVDGGLDFPGDLPPDYWDFLYFSMVLGMTFQVSDVQITARKFRRLATAHGLIGFLFDTVIVALTVNIASSLL